MKAAHATQENLRLVKNPDTGVVTVRHDHSVARALNRGLDFPEGPQVGEGTAYNLRS